MMGRIRFFDAQETLQATTGDEPPLDDGKDEEAALGAGRGIQ
jgi:hypothetical protein